MAQVKVQRFLLIILAIGITAPVAEGCSCIHAHLQDLFCYSPLVFRAKIIEQKIAPPSYRLHGEEMIEYKIKLIKMFKGFNQVDTIQYIYTSVEESLCGVYLDAKNKVQYLLSGHLWHDGKVLVELCGIVRRWKNLLLSQKKKLKYRYQKGCECKISTCYKSNCHAKSENECAWYPYSRQTLHGVCLKRTNGTCNWYINSSGSHTQHNVGQKLVEVKKSRPTETIQ
ncbi:LOW QUALITY PROTEIN: metalloproteinase inhibitor 4-like [Tachysurus vachellii]|uniref:LOW QUALITY PROTEIN: metalloproteinase inhibitor 4-like n=1 Tax=Tachysurus vachellii TaxID=175792 RepID=UPI00296B1DDD|nr:LOW QUALITY PROTEIN: metalloproteinase inhibitor 4-like [Tachysurus vachellii]